MSQMCTFVYSERSHRDAKQLKIDQCKKKSKTKVLPVVPIYFFFKNFRFNFNCNRLCISAFSVSIKHLNAASRPSCVIQQSSVWTGSSRCRLWQFKQQWLGYTEPLWPLWFYPVLWSYKCKLSEKIQCPFIQPVWGKKGLVPWSFCMVL